MHVKGDTCTHGLGFACFNIAPIFHACARATCMSLRYSDAPECGLLRNPDMWASNRQPTRRSSDRGRTLLFCVYLGQMMIQHHVTSQAYGTILPAFTGTGSFPLI